MQLPNGEQPEVRTSRFWWRAYGFAFGCLAVMASCLCFVDPYAGSSNKTDDAINQCTMLEAACKNYRERHGTLPPSLRELIAPFDGKSPLIDGGSNAITDPWGSPYQYDSDHLNEKAEPDPIVFTVTPKGKKLMTPQRQPRSIFPW